MRSDCRAPGRLREVPREANAERCVVEDNRSCCLWRCQRDAAAFATQEINRASPSGCAQDQQLPRRQARPGGWRKHARGRGQPITSAAAPPPDRMRRPSPRVRTRKPVAHAVLLCLPWSFLSLHRGRHCQQHAQKVPAYQKALFSRRRRSHRSYEFFPAARDGPRHSRSAATLRGHARLELADATPGSRARSRARFGADSARSRWCHLHAEAGEHERILVGEL